MDGSAFEQCGTDAAVPLATRPDTVSDRLSAETLQVATSSRETHRHWLCVLAAAAAHIALITLLQPTQTDTMGEDGVALETVAVSIVDSVPRQSAPGTASPVTSVRPPDAEADEAASDAQPQAPAVVPEQNEPHKQALALALPPEPAPPEAPALPALRPEAAPEPPPVVADEPSDLRDQPIPAPDPLPPSPEPSAAAAAAAVRSSLSAAEASSGVVRAYAGSVSRVLERQKPSNRGMSGRVRIQFVIDQSGRAEPPVVLATSGNPALDNIVMTAVQRMDFPPPPPAMSLRQRTFTVPFSFR